MLYAIGKFLCGAVLYALYRIKIEGVENLPADGAAIVCSNHKSLIDPVLIGVCLKRKIHFMAKHELFKIPLLGSIIKGVGAFPVKRGKADIESIKTSLQVLEDGNVLGLFPEGTRVKKGKKSSAQPGAALIAIKSGAPVVPVASIGSYKLFGKIRVVIGEPFRLELEDKKRSAAELREISEDIMQRVRNLMKG